MGGTKMLAKVYDSQFEVVGKERKRTKGHDGHEAGLERIIKTIRKALQNAEVKPDQLGGIGIGFPGPIDMENGKLLEAVNLGWEKMPLKDSLENEFGCGVAIANDVDVGVFGEYRFGAAQSARCVIGVFPGTGIGGGCVYDGKILRGKYCSSMEIGHLQVNPNGQLCGCGRFGCLETEASRLAIAAEAAKAVYRGEAPHLSEAAGVNLRDIRSAALAESIKAGDKAVKQIVQRAAAKIGVAVANVTNVMLPDVVILGGGLVEAMPEIFVETVEAVAKETVMPPFAKMFTVAAAKLGDDSTVLGAAAWAADCLSADA